MSQNALFSRRFDVGAEMLVDFLQNAMAVMPMVRSYQLADSGDRISFTTSFTLTSWGGKMVAVVEPDGLNGAAITVSGKPRVGLLSTPWGEELHAATIETQLFAALDRSVHMARTDPIVMLRADHRRVEALFARIQTNEGDERAKLVQQLLQSLRVHMALEESHVYPLLREEVNLRLAEQAGVEHQLARDGLAQLEKLTPDEPGFDGALAMVNAGIAHHVNEEESDVFPRLASQLGPDRLAELADQLTSVRANLLKQVERPPRSVSKPAPTRDRALPKQREAKANHPRPPKPQQNVGRTSRTKRPTLKADQLTSVTANVLKQVRNPPRSALKPAPTRDKALPKQREAESKQPQQQRPAQLSVRDLTPRTKQPTMRIDPDKTTKAQLIQQAKRYGLSSYSHMSKAELAQAISKVG